MEFEQLFKNNVIQNFSIEKNKQLFQEAGNHLIMSNDQRKFIGDRCLEDWLRDNITSKLELK